MSDYRQAWVQDLRLCILKVLSNAPGNSANTSVLQRAVDVYGFRVTRPELNAELGELHRIGAVQNEQLDDDLCVAELTQRGQDHLDRRLTLPGVKPPSLS